MMSINPNYIYFSKFDEVGRKKIELTEQEKKIKCKNLKYNEKRESNNNLSVITQRKIKKFYNWMFKKSYNKFVEHNNRTFKHKLSFITLTLPTEQTHTDTDIKKCLNQFFTEFQKIHLLNNYIWKSELQKNGNIHFHIITDSFIPWNVIRKKWNRIIDKLGYIKEFSEKMKKIKTYKNYLKKFRYEDTIKRQNYYLQEKRTGWKNPNTVDVKNVIGKKHADIYLIKYISKNDNEESEKRKITGKRVGFSEKLQQIKYLSSFVKDKKEFLFQKFYQYTDIQIKVLDYGTIMIYQNIVDYADKFLGGLISQFFDEFIKYEPSIFDVNFYKHHFNQVLHKI